MTAYLVNRSRGMTRDQVDAFSPGYIAGWSRGNPAVMHQAVDKATRAFNKITELEKRLNALSEYVPKTDINTGVDKKLVIDAGVVTVVDP